MKFRMLTLLQNVFCIALMVGQALASSEDYYTAAVFEHAREGDEIQDNAAVVIKANLENYERATRAAAQQGADIILFPEYGIFHPRNRTETKSYLEEIPDPNEITVTPCNEPELFVNRPIIYSLSCMSKSNKIVVVANMGGMEYCENKTGCHDDGAFHFNANVAFDQKGTLIGRYYKERLFYEPAMDLPRKKQNPIFRTDFGKFAMFASFDAMFQKMSLVSQVKDIDAVLLSALWINYPPFYPMQYFQGWAIGNNATLIVANQHFPRHLITGSGIFMGKKGSIGHVLSPDGIPKLIVATIPKSNRKNFKPFFNILAILKNGTQIWNDDGVNISGECSNRIIDPKKPYHSMHEHVCLNENTSNYTLVKLTKAMDHLEACHNNMCCELDYVANNMNESFYLGVFNGSHAPFTRYLVWEENCFLARCEDTDAKACSVFPLVSETLFYKVYIRANFSSRKIYPSFVADKLKLVPVQDWVLERTLERSSIALEIDSGIRLLTATLKGRVYEKDPPYVR